MDALSELRGMVGRLARAGSTEAATALPRLHLGFASAPTEPSSVMTASTLALVIQGSKRTGLGSHTFDYGAGHLLITSVRAPITTQITHASRKEPFLGIGLTMQPAIVASVLLKAPSTPAVERPRAIVTSKASEELLDAFRRYVRLLEAPEDIPVLAEAIEREIIWRVIQSAQGAALRESGLEQSNLTRISRAIDLLQTRFSEALSVADLARAARMSTATFNRHFRRVTALSPMQFQKQLRLQDARMRLLSLSADVHDVSFAVGYRSPSQFSRDYRRQFGRPPIEDSSKGRKR